MLRNFTISVKKASSTLSFPLEKRLFVSPILGFSTTNVTSKQPPKSNPFKSFQNNRKSDSDQINLDSVPKKQNAARSIMIKTLESCKEITPKPDFLDESYKETLEVIIHKLSGLSKSIYKHQAKILSNYKTKDHVREIDVYLPNKVLNEKNVSDNLDEIATNLTKAYQVNENQILVYIHHYAQAVECCSRFEKFHEHTEFWNTLSRVINNIVSKGDNTLLKDKSILNSFIKAITRHKFYSQLQASINKSVDITEHIKQVDKTQKILIDLVVQNQDLDNWVSTIVQLHKTKDDQFATLSSKLNEKLNTIDNSVDVSFCLTKLKGLQGDKNVSNLYKRFTEIALKRAQMNLLSTDQISITMSSLISSKGGDLSEKDFNALWNNLSHNINDKKDKNFTWASICSLMTTINLSAHFTEERSEFLQQCAHLAQQRTPEPNEELTEEKKPKDNTPLSNEDLKANIMMLYTISQDKRIDYKLLKKMVPLLKNNVSKIHEASYASVLLSSSKIITQLSNNRDESQVRSLKDSTLALYNGVFNLFLKKLKTAKNTEITKAFHSSCLLGVIGAESYEILANEIIRKINLFQPYDCAHILWGIAEIQNNPATRNINTEHLEETILQSITNYRKEISNDTFRSTVFVLKQARALKSLIKIREKLETELMNRVNSLPFQDLIVIICWLHGAGLISQEGLMRVEPFIIKGIEQARIRDLCLIMQTFVNNHLRPKALFNVLEDKIISILDEYLSNKPTLDADSLRYLAVIFNEAAKSKFDKKELMEKFELFFEKYLGQFGLLETLQIIESMGTYLSSNVKLLKGLLQVVNEKLQTEANRQILLEKTANNAIRAFQLGMFTIGLEYKQEIDLKDYKEIYNIDKHLAAKIDELRLVQPYISPYQRFVTNILKSMGYDIEEEYSIGVFVVDILIKPNKIIEISGPYNYIHGTDTLTLKAQKRMRQLEKSGYKIVRIQAEEWEEQQKLGKIEEYLRKQIES